MLTTNYDDYTVIYHGIDHDQYFTPKGTYGTKFNAFVTGIGATVQEAYDDALEQVCELIPDNTLNMDDLEPWGLSDIEVSAEDADDCHIYVEIQFNLFD